MPRFAAAMAGTMLVGREFYRFGYLTNEGATSKIREAGAIPLNLAGVLLTGSIAMFIFKRQTGGFFSRRKTVRRFTTNAYDIRMEKVLKDAESAKRAPIVSREHPAMLPMHPKIMDHMAKVREEAIEAAKPPS